MPTTFLNNSVILYLQLLQSALIKVHLKEIKEFWFFFEKTPYYGTLILARNLNEAFADCILPFQSATEI